LPARQRRCRCGGTAGELAMLAAEASRGALFDGRDGWSMPRCEVAAPLVAVHLRQGDQTCAGTLAEVSHDRAVSADGEAEVRVVLSALRITGERGDAAAVAYEVARLVALVPPSMVSAASAIRARRSDGSAGTSRPVLWRPGEAARVWMAYGLTSCAWLRGRLCRLGRCWRARDGFLLARPWARRWRRLPRCGGVGVRGRVRTCGGVVAGRRGRVGVVQEGGSGGPGLPPGRFQDGRWWRNCGGSVRVWRGRGCPGVRSRWSPSRSAGAAVASFAGAAAR
jgi:hypothetical protein